MRENYPTSVLFAILVLHTRASPPRSGWSNVVVAFRRSVECERRPGWTQNTSAFAGLAQQQAQQPGGDEENMSSTDRSTVALNAEGYLEPSPNERIETHNFKGIKDM